jgi:phosphate starvation-inducible protein PhoH
MTNIRQKIEEANQKAVEKIIAAQPVLVDIGPALKVLPGMKENMILYSGPPIEWERMSEPQRSGAIDLRASQIIQRTLSN